MNTQTALHPDLIDSAEVAQLLGCSQWTLHRMETAGTLLPVGTVGHSRGRFLYLRCDECGRRSVTSKTPPRPSSTLVSRAGDRP